jgi:hypothetical protein
MTSSQPLHVRIAVGIIRRKSPGWYLFYELTICDFACSASDCPSVRPILAIFSLFFQYSRTQAVCAQGHFCPFCTIFTLQPAKAFTLLPCLTPSLPHSLTHSLTPSLPHSLTPSLTHSLSLSLFLTPSPLSFLSFLSFAHSLILASAELFYLQHARSRG